MSNPYKNVPVDPYMSGKDALNKLLLNIERVQSFSDVNIAGDRIVSVKSKGRVHRVGKVPLNQDAVNRLVSEVFGGSNVPGDIKSGRLLDDTHRFSDEENRIVYRYRTSLVAMRSGREQSLKLNLRSLSSELPTLEYVSVTQELYDYIMDGPGLVIVSGETGSGKTTTLSGIFAHLIRSSGGEDAEGKIVSTYEEPVEYEYYDLINKIAIEYGCCNTEVFQHEIGRDIRDWAGAPKNAFRSNPDIILLGEARELKTIESALIFAQSGHLVFITTHAKGALSTINRLVQEFPSERQDAARASFLASTKFILSQQLVPRDDGGMVPLRETLKIPETAQRRFTMTPSGDQTRVFSEYFRDFGMTFKAHSTELFEQGHISQKTHKLICMREG